MMPSSPISGIRTEYRTLRELVQRQIRDEIVYGKFPPGTKLVETELAQLYGVSRGPIREAIRALEGQGLVRSVANKGVVVSTLSPSEIREIYDIRIELEGLAARLGASNISATRLKQMQGSLERMSEVVQNEEQWLSYNNRFHFILYEASGRKRLCVLINDLIHAVDPYIRLFLRLPGKLANTHSDHFALLDAAQRHDSIGCETITREHLRRSADIIVELGSDTDGEPPQDATLPQKRADAAVEGRVEQR
jgi:DNA-binding GntR family transcriptional regulator